MFPHNIPRPIPPSTSSSAPRALGSGAASDMIAGMGKAIENLDDVGLDLPVHELPMTDIGPGGVVGALERQDTKAWAKVAKRLGRDWWVRLDWGTPPPGGWERVVEEGERAWPLMTPGRILRGDGQVLEGVSPSGAARGDRFVVTSDQRLDSAVTSAGVVNAPCAAVRGLADQLSALGVALSDSLAAEPRLQMTITRNTEGLLACFPGNGAKYNCHYDGGGTDPRKLTAILYVNPEWHDEADGRLMMYDAGSFSAAHGPGEKCWRSVRPRAGSLVLFRSDLVLHKVNPTWERRFALTMFYAAKTSSELKRDASRTRRQEHQQHEHGVGIR